MQDNELTTELLQKLMGQGALILTPNKALCDQLRRSAIQALSGVAVRSLNIHVFASWLADQQHTGLWSDAAPDKRYATESQLLHLWRQVIDQQRDQFPGVQPAVAASKALSAWRQLLLWQVDRTALEKSEWGQQLCFSRWVEQFEQRLAKLELTTPDLLARDCPQILECQLCEHLVLYGFNDLPPLWQSCFEQACGRVTRYSPGLLSGAGPSPGQLDLKGWIAQPYRCESDSEELHTAFSWAYNALIKEGKERVAIVDLKLTDRCLQVRRQATKHGRYNRVSTDKAIRRVQVGFSQKPGRQHNGAIQSALHLIRLNHRDIARAEARYIAQSPFWGSHFSEHHIRAFWEACICSAESLMLSSSQVKGYINNQVIGLTAPDHSNQKSTELIDQSGQCISQRLTDAFVHIQLPKSAYPTEWAIFFDQQIKALGWPGEWLEGTEREATIEIWQQMLTEFCQLDRVSEAIAVEEATALMGTLCSQSEPDIERLPAQGIHVLDTLQSAVDYDAVWLMGMDDQNWPATVSPNPLLPISLQVELDMPRASAARETRIAQGLLQDVLRCNREVICSYSAWDGDMPKVPTRMLNGPAATTLGGRYLIDDPTLDTAAFAASTGAEQPRLPYTDDLNRFEWIDCSRAPAVAVTPGTMSLVSGGTALISTMVSSPFIAHLRWRAGAQPLSRRALGQASCSAGDKGNLVHLVMERLWAVLGDSATLVAQTEDALSARCTQIIETVITHHALKHRQSPESAFWQAQRGWLLTLIMQWLAVEKQRPAFRVIDVEKRYRLGIASLEFDVRVDRVDQDLASQDYFVVDYKTGAIPHRDNWLHSPPLEPQLPLYALAVDDPVTLVCCAGLREDDMGFYGLAAQDYLDGDRGLVVVPDWDGQVRQWHQDIEKLVERYLSGCSENLELATPYQFVDEWAPLHRFAEYEDLKRWFADLF